MKMKTWGVLTISSILTASLIQPILAQPGADPDVTGEPANPRFGGERLHGDRHARAAIRSGFESQQRITEHMDSDGDGLASEAEFVESRLQQTDAFFERKDSNQDGLISEEENEVVLMPGRAKYVVRPRRPEFDRAEIAQCVQETLTDHSPALDAAAEIRFDNADTDNDGMLSLAEVSTARESRSRELFGRFDTDDDGFVTDGELAGLLDGQPKLRQVLRTCIKDAAN